MVGSGYIAVELAGILRALGSDVTLVIRYNKVLRSFDSMLSDSLMTELQNSGVKIASGSKVSQLLCWRCCHTPPLTGWQGDKDGGQSDCLPDPPHGLW